MQLGLKLHYWTSVHHFLSLLTILLGSSITPQPGCYLRISKGGHGSSLTSYQLLFILPLKNNIPMVFPGESGLVKLGVLFPEFPISVLLSRMIIGLVYLQVPRQHSSHYKAEFRNSRSSARLRSLCRAEKQRQWFNSPVISGPRLHNPAFWGAFASQHAAQQTLPHSNSWIWPATSSVWVPGGGAREWVLRRDATADKLSLSLFHETFSNWLPVEALLGCHHVAHSLLRRELTSRTDAILLRQLPLYTQQALGFGKYHFFLCLSSSLQHYRKGTIDSDSFST